MLAIEPHHGSHTIDDYSYDCRGSEQAYVVWYKMDKEGLKRAFTTFSAPSSSQEEGMDLLCTANTGATVAGLTKVAACAFKMDDVKVFPSKESILVPYALS
eukprot:scaffold244_cov172-Amphora_coffeaeformis.AAC.32